MKVFGLVKYLVELAGVYFHLPLQFGANQPIQKSIFDISASHHGILLKNCTGSAVRDSWRLPASNRKCRGRVSSNRTFLKMGYFKLYVAKYYQMHTKGRVTQRLRRPPDGTAAALKKLVGAALCEQQPVGGYA